MTDTEHETKQNASHTPKPRIKRFDAVDGEFFLITRENGRLLAKAFNTDDARLIAASPKLLAFAEAIRNSCAVQANLCSTATEEERTQFIHSIYVLWNDHGLIAVDEAKGLAA